MRHVVYWCALNKTHESSGKTKMDALWLFLIAGLGCVMMEDQQ